MNYKARIKSLKKILYDKELDAILLSSTNYPDATTVPNIYYFTGFYEVWPVSLFVTKANESLFTFDTEKARTETEIKTIIDFSEKKLSDYIKEMNGHKMKLGIDGNLDYNYYSKLKKKLPGCKLIDISKELSLIRSIKDDSEIMEIKKACLLTDRVLSDLTSEGLVGKSEKIIAERIKQLIVGCGKEWAFPVLVSGDEGSSAIHGIPTQRKYKNNLLIDLGLKNNHYNSDVSRSFIFSDNPEINKAYSDLKELHGYLDDNIEAGMPSDYLNKLAKEFLDKKGHNTTSYANFHALGHGVGLEVHEFPSISAHTSFTLKKNMVFTLEPAIYVKGKYGIRIEDTVVMGSKGIERLSRYRF